MKKVLYIISFCLIFFIFPAQAFADTIEGNFTISDLHFSSINSFNDTVTFKITSSYDPAIPGNLCDPGIPNTVVNEIMFADETLGQYPDIVYEDYPNGPFVDCTDPLNPILTIHTQNEGFYQGTDYMIDEFRIRQNIYTDTDTYVYFSNPVKAESGTFEIQSVSSTYPAVTLTLNNFDPVLTTAESGCAGSDAQFYFFKSLSASFYFNDDSRSCTVDVENNTLTFSRDIYTDFEPFFTETFGDTCGYWQAFVNSSGRSQNWFPEGVDPNASDFLAELKNNNPYHFSTNCSPTPDPVTVTFNSVGDTYVRSGQGNRNFGGGTFMRVQPSGDNRALVKFDQNAMQSTISGTVLEAKLRVTITDNNNSWGATGRTVDVHRLISDWTEGTGTENNQGTGSGATWNCAIDSIISNAAKNCSGTTEWEMGQPNNPSVHPWVQTATDSETITNNQTGVVEYDVTSDVAAFMNGTNNYGWIIRKTNEGQNGQVSFGTRESTSDPQLVVTYQP
jgi:hypothetical protein